MSGDYRLRFQWAGSNGEKDIAVTRWEHRTKGGIYLPKMAETQTEGRKLVAFDDN